MFFVLSKTLSYLVRPLAIICVSFLLAWLLKNPSWKKRFFFLGLTLLLFFSNDFIANEVMRAWEVKATPFADLKKNYEYGILLSGSAKLDADPSDRVYIVSAADRVNHTLQLYKLGFIRKVLVSGGSGQLLETEQREAEQLASLLELMGISPSDIVIENASRNTHESAVEVKKMLESKTTPDQCLLITSANHIRRSRACFLKAGWPVETFSADFLSHRRRFTPDILLIPRIEALNTWNVIIKEWVGYVAYDLVGYI